jgi:hypothetical protein
MIVSEMVEALTAEKLDPGTRARIAHAAGGGIAARLRRQEAVALARKMLGEGYHRAAIRDAMQARFRLSRRTAYRMIELALNAR